MILPTSSPFASVNVLCVRCLGPLGSLFPCGHLSTPFVGQRPPCAQQRLNAFCRQVFLGGWFEENCVNVHGTLRGATDAKMRE